MDNCSQKRIIVRYGKVNQWRIYNAKTTKIYVLFSIQFNKSFNYYDTSHKIANKDKNNDKLDNIWNKANDKKFGKVMTRRQVKKEVIFTYLTL